MTHILSFIVMLAPLVLAIIAAQGAHSSHPDPRLALHSRRAHALLLLALLLSGGLVLLVALLLVGAVSGAEGQLIIYFSTWEILAVAGVAWLVRKQQRAIRAMLGNATLIVLAPLVGLLLGSTTWNDARSGLSLSIPAALVYSAVALLLGRMTHAAINAPERESSSSAPGPR